MAKKTSKQRRVLLAPSKIKTFREAHNKAGIVSKREQLVAKYGTKAESPVSFKVVIAGKSYPFSFTKDQLNKAYGKAKASVLANQGFTDLK